MGSVGAMNALEVWASLFVFAAVLALLSDARRS
jgi:hypothetical protein